MLPLALVTALSLAPPGVPAGDLAKPGAVIVYLSTEHTLLVWSASGPNQLALDSVAIGRDSLGVLIAGLRRSIAPSADLTTCRSVPVSGNIDIAAAALAGVLLPPRVRRAIAPAIEVVIIPQGALQLVPFALLPVDSAGTFLGVRNPLRYAPSLASLIQAERRPAVPRGDRGRWRASLIVANPTMPRIPACGTVMRPAQLPATVAFSRRLADSLGAPFLTDSAATISAVRRQLQGAPLVHLATHGYAYSSEERARDSWLALAAAGESNGLLTVGEIIDHDSLTAELVVLAACETGLGDARHAEGVIGLQRAFLAKGARSVLVSLWTVNEAATMRLIEVFYQQWFDAPDRPSKAEALRRAEASVRDDPAHPEWKSPKYWAGFVLVGAG